MKQFIANIALFSASALLAVTCSLGSVSAQVNDFTETFETTANWMDGQSPPAPVELVVSGGPDGSSYISTDFSFEFFPDGSGMGGGQPAPVIFRGQDEFGSSSGAFEGDWITSNVDQLTFSFRHNLPSPANVFARFSGPSNFPGALFVEFAPSFPNQWTEITVDIEENSFISFEGTDFASVFSNVGHVQFGVSVPLGLGGTPDVYTFDVDNVSVTTIPEPACGLALCGMTILLARRRR